MHLMQIEKHGRSEFVHNLKQLTMPSYVGAVQANICNLGSLPASLNCERSITKCSNLAAGRPHSGMICHQMDRGGCKIEIDKVYDCANMILAR